jgi:hypothetical protein
MGCATLAITYSVQDWPRMDRPTGASPTRKSVLHAMKNSAMGTGVDVRAGAGNIVSYFPVRKNSTVYFLNMK